MRRDLTFWQFLNWVQKLKCSSCNFQAFFMSKSCVKMAIEVVWSIHSCHCPLIHSHTLSVAHPLIQWLSSVYNSFTKTCICVLICPFSLELYTMLYVHNSLMITHVQCFYLAIQNSTQNWNLFFSNEGNYAKNRSFTDATTSLLAGESVVHLRWNMCKFWFYADFFIWLTTNIISQHVSVCNLPHTHHFLHVLMLTKMKRDKGCLLM